MSRPGQPAVIQSSTTTITGWLTRGRCTMAAVMTWWPGRTLQRSSWGQVTVVTGTPSTIHTMGSVLGVTSAASRGVEVDTGVSGS